MPLGRPTKYDPSFCEEIILYFSVKPYFKKAKAVHDEYGEEIESNEQGKVEVSDFPNFAGFAAQIGVHRETLLNWCDQHPDFFDAYKRAKELQENWLVVNGMAGNINTAFGIFIAKNVTDMRDNKELTIQGGDPKKPITVQKIELKDRIEQLESGDGE